MSNVAAISQNQIAIEESSLYAPESESWFLALLMKCPDKTGEALRLIKPSDFFCGNNKYVYEIMSFIWNNAQKQNWQMSFDAMSMLMVARSLGTHYEREFLVKSDGMKTIKVLENYTHHVQPVQFDQLAGAVLDRSVRVGIYRRARQTMMASMDVAGNPDARKIAGETSGDMTQIAFSNEKSDESTIKRIGAAETDYLLKVRINKVTTGQNLLGLYLNHLPFLIGVMGGIRRKGLTVCTARPKTGKTTFAGAIAIQAAVEQNIPTLYCDSEMSSEEMYSRSMSNISKLNEGDIMAGKFYAEGGYTPAMGEAVYKLRQAPFYYINVSGMSPDNVSAVIREFRTRYVGTQTFQDPQDGTWHKFSRPALAIYDWIKLADSTDLKHAAEHQMLGYLCSSLKNAARVNDIPIFALGQNNREAGKAKKSSDWEDNAEMFVGGSDRIAQFCSALMTLRNVTREEAKQISNAGLRPGEAPDAMTGKVNPNSLKFNQVMHFIFNRSGGDFRSGIPLYLNRGTSSYQEMATEECFNILRTLKSKPTASESAAQIPANIGGQVMAPSTLFKPEAQF